jgi:hypothetical protein
MSLFERGQLKPDDTYSFRVCCKCVLFPMSVGSYLAAETIDEIYFGLVLTRPLVGSTLGSQA